MRNHKFLVFYSIIAFILMSLEFIRISYLRIEWISPIFIIFKLIGKIGSEYYLSLYNIFLIPTILFYLPLTLLGFKIKRINNLRNPLQTNISRIASLLIVLNITSSFNRLMFFLLLQNNNGIIFYLNPVWIVMFSLQSAIVFFTATLPKTQETQKITLITYIQFIYMIIRLFILQYIFTISDGTAILILIRGIITLEYGISIFYLLFYENYMKTELKTTNKISINLQVKHHVSL